MSWLRLAAVVVVALTAATPEASAAHGGPSVQITAPATGSTVHGDVALSVSVSSTSSITRVDYAVDGRTVGSSTRSPWTYTWRSSTVKDGKHTITATATDSRRKQASSSIAVTTQNAAPDTTLTSTPAASTFSTDASFAFTSDTQGATFRCSLDGATPAACTSPAAYSGLAVGGHTFSVAAVDGYGTADPTPATYSWTIQAPQSLVANGDFEGTLQGWGSSTAKLSLANDGTSGPGAAVVTWNGTSGSYSLVSASSARPVPTGVLGDTYVSWAYVRSDTPGKTVCLTVREWQNTWTWIGSSSQCVTTTSSWQEVGPLYYSQTLAGDGLDLSINQKDAPSAGDSFEVDGVRMQHLTPVAQAQPSDPTIVAAGDVAGCWTNSDEQTAALVQSMPWATVQLLGDNAYPDGGRQPYACYDQTWGRFKSRTHPAVGNHDYDTPGASVYYDYFGAAAGDPSKGYYSYDLGTWHVIVLNSNCSQIGGCWSWTAEETWLRADLKAHPSQCTLAVMHHPVYTSVKINNDGPYTALWKDLVNAHVDLLLNGHSHVYERFTTMDASGNYSPTGTREITVGTGGAELMEFQPTFLPTSEVHAQGVYGVLEVVLHPGSYDWKFVPVLGETFTDSGSSPCH
jgi:hypothetical protein